MNKLLSTALRAWGLFAAAWAIANLVRAWAQQPGDGLAAAAMAAWPAVLWTLAWACTLPRRHASALDIEAQAWESSGATPPMPHRGRPAVRTRSPHQLATRLAPTSRAA